MARIRSIFPGLFTDEAFVSVSMPARVLLLGIWTEADDQGVFEWKPVTLKMRIFSADNIDVVPLLGELETANAVRRFSFEGKPHGAIRNFCKYQKPKTPKFRDVKDAEIRNYVASKYQKEETETSKPEPFPQNGEMNRRREEGGGSEDETKGRDSISRALFLEFWKAFPRRDSDEQPERAEEKFNALVKTGVDPKVITIGAAAYCAKTRKQNNYATRFVKQAWRWLGEQDWGGTAVCGPDVGSDPEPAEKDWRSAVRLWKLNESNWPRWAGNAPGSRSCQCPPEILADLDVDPSTGLKIDASWHFAEIETPELTANLNFAERHKLRVHIYDFTRDGVTKTGAHFMKKIPPGYDEATGERIAPADQEENAA